jgi:membrane-bound lytic murein transglycosylase D
MNLNMINKITTLLLMMISWTSLSANEQHPDSLPSQLRELVIIPTDASEPSEQSTSVNSATTKPSNSTSLLDLHPLAIPFVKDYLEDNTSRLVKMKGWGMPYFRMIDNIFAQYHIPAELKYLAVVESNLKSTAVSYKGAVGPWQFMPETGRTMGLRVSPSYDERTDLYKSTHAAAKYLRALYKQMGDWLLVIAAYNGGPGRVESAIRKSNSRDFWKLQYQLPAESRNHVKKFIATHYIMEGKGGETTGIPVKPTNTDAAIDSNLIRGTTTQTITGKFMSLIIAKNLTMDIQYFNILNPEFDNKVGIEAYSLRLPVGKMEAFNANRMTILAESVQFFLNNTPVDKDKFPGTIELPTGRKENSITGTR